VKRVLLLAVAFLSVGNLAAADLISVYSDATGSSCGLNTGFTTTATVMHKFTPGATASRFRLQLPAGSAFFAFNSQYQVLGSILDDGTVQYGQCLNGSFPIGTITAILTQGVLWVRPVDGQAYVLTADCSFVEQIAACGSAAVGYGYSPYCDSCLTLATEQSTWGAVKSLYR
jgi:hypothetical protein